MNYQQACDRLDKPRRQTGKNLGHKLRLFYDGAWTDENDVTKPKVTLQYFDTGILEWRHDGGVRIDAEGFWDSSCTQQKLNEYSPRGWRIQQHHLRFAPKMRCASVNIRTDTYELVRSMPYEDGALYFEDGRADAKGSPLNDFNASEIVGDIAATVEETVMAFLYGELARPTIEEDIVALEVSTMAGVVDHALRKNQVIIDIAKAKRASAPLVWWVIDTEWKNSFRMNQLELYEPKNYPFTGVVRSMKERVAQMEHFLRVGHDRTRYKKNSEEFHAMKKDLMSECEQMLLKELGFGVKEFERRPRSDRAGW